MFFIIYERFPLLSMSPNLGLPLFFLVIIILELSKLITNIFLLARILETIMENIEPNLVEFSFRSCLKAA